MDIGSALESDYPRRLAKKRSHTRRGAQDCLINMAEAIREIAHGLHLHRSSSSSSCVSKRDPTNLLECLVSVRLMFQGLDLRRDEMGREGKEKKRHARQRRN
ncbi:unnamed protein product [Dovyalis caffra]|uniref:Uncharacterized protein n=1 Tax=Dovyalis caffra TaxID=77055 RepID=A0AAV1RTB1_9ROSI|nr:unnamed protein product [Dovyalis caffra]